jgi:LPXTG-motif cell wall-anchored protein
VSDKHFDITNTGTYELPATGGSGTLPYLLVGLVLIAGSSLAGFIWMHKQRRENDM